jgi:hypothetical protein
MARADDLAELHSSLEGLLARGENDEKLFQAWFETHPQIFDVLGYRQWIPHPRLPISASEAYVPDFLVCDHRGVWHVFELKRPDTAQIKAQTRRVGFLSAYSDYLEQCREYSEWFCEGANRALIRSAYGADIQKTVPAVLVAGVDSHTDNSVVREKLIDRGNKVTALTYTEVLRSLEREIDRHTQEFERAPGISCVLFGIFPQGTEPQVIVDYGRHSGNNRLVIGLSKEHFTIRVFHHDGAVWNELIRRPFIVEYRNASPLTMLEVEIGHRGGSLQLQAFLDRRIVLRKVAPGSFDFHQITTGTIGTDKARKVSADFALVEFGEYARTLGWRERARVRTHFDEVYRRYLSPLAIFNPARVTFKGPKWMDRNYRETVFNPRSGPSSWFVASGVTLADGRRVAPDPYLGTQTVTLPGMEKHLDYGHPTLT